MFVQPVWAGVRASRQSHKAGRYAVTQACSCYQAEQAGPPRHPPPAQQEGHLSVLGRDNSRGACQKSTLLGTTGGASPVGAALHAQYYAVSA